MKCFHKKGIELSVNFLVVIILSLVMLSMGIYLIREFFETTADLRDALDQQTEEQLTQLLQEGKLVALARTRKTIPVGESALFGLGILNINPGDGKRTFEIHIQSPEEAVGYDSLNNPIQADTSTWLKYQRTLELGPNEAGSIAIRVEPQEGVPKGTYIFNVAVTTQESPYKNTKFWVVV